MKTKYVVVACALFLSCVGALAADMQALVIGNGNYTRISKLANTRHDAEVVASNLRILGFQVTYLPDASGRAMREAATAYVTAAARPGSVSFFYYSGHGAQAEGANWLLGTDASASPQVWKDASLNVHALLASMPTNADSVHVTVLDACRTLPDEWRRNGVLEGLGMVQAPAGSLIAFATAPGADASGGLQIGGLSLYTKHLVRELRQVAVPLDRVFQVAHSAVVEESGGKQIPWIHSSMTRPFYLLPGFVGDNRVKEGTTAVASVSPQGLVELQTLLGSRQQAEGGSLDEGTRTRIREILRALTGGVVFTSEEVTAISLGQQKVGARFAPVPHYAATKLGVAPGAGLLVASVDPGSRVARWLREGDVLLEVNGRKVGSIDELLRFASAEVIPGSEVRAVVLRNAVATKVVSSTEHSSVPDMVFEAATWNFNVRKDYRRAQELAAWSADRGSSDAQVLLANLAANGLGNRFLPDYAEVLKRAQSAADAGNLRGKFWLMQASLRGWGVPRSMQRANEIRQEAAAQGAPWAITGLGVAYFDGQGVPVDYKKALQYLEMGAAFSHPDALVTLGYMHEKGLEVTKDLNAARVWYERAIATGNINATQMANAGLQRIRGSF